MNLTSKKCIPCEVGGEAMQKDQIYLYAKDVPEWKVAPDQKKISRAFKFKDFKTALEFVNKIGALADEQGHHPDVLLSYGKVVVELSTHAVGGLTENDFIMAAKIDGIK